MIRYIGEARNMIRYKYTVEGKEGGGETWRAQGFIETQNPGDFATVPQLAMRDSFMQLTEGKAEFGRPGVTCRGPYMITMLQVQEVPS
jgi:hypothetical protein